MRPVIETFVMQKRLGHKKAAFPFERKTAFLLIAKSYSCYIAYGYLINSIPRFYYNRGHTVGYADTGYRTFF